MRRFLISSPAKTSWALFQGLFVIAALLAVSATFVAISGADPNAPTEGGMIWLLGFNLILIAVLAWIVFLRYRQMQDSKARSSDSGLVRRFLVLFSLAAILPAAIVAIFLGVTITRGIDNWFSERVDTIVEETADIARTTVDDFIRLFEGDTLNARRDFDETVEADEETEFLTGQLILGTFFAAYLVDENGRVLSEAREQNPALYRPPSSTDLAEANSGEVAQTLYERAGLATAVIRSEKSPDTFLYFYREFDPKLIAQLRTAEQALSDFRAAEERSARLQWLFIVGYAQIAALILLLSWRFGLEAGGQFTGPIGRLAIAAHAVKDGDLTVRVPIPQSKDELRTLTQSFNAMTAQLSTQREELISAREDADDRRQFMETLLAEVSAGVIRTDGDLVVTQSNRSAETLLDAALPIGEKLGDVSSVFADFAERTIRTGQPIDDTVDFSLNGATKHFRIKTALDPAQGCVITFDDTTGLVNVQRQLAWRDVARRIAHEIRNPLTPIQLSTERLRRRYLNQFEDDGVFERCLDTIQRQVADIGRMVEEFSAFARMPKPSLAPFDFVALLDRTAFAQRMVSPDISIEVVGNREAPLFLGDERLLGQAFGNIIKNGAQAIQELPTMEDTDGLISVKLTVADNSLSVDITDNGSGLPEENAHRLLEPYVTTKAKGTGLGLAIVNRIIRDHGGSVSISQRKDGSRGAIANIRLPIVETGYDEDDRPAELAQAVLEDNFALVRSSDG